MLALLAHWFAAVCGQDPGHTWAPGGILLPCCQRCTGLYVGAGAAALLHLWLRPKLSGRFLEIHGAFLVVMVPFGFHWVAQGPVLRTLTGVLFGFGVVTFLWLPLSQRAAEQSDRSEGRNPKAEGNPKPEDRIRQPPRGPTSRTGDAPLRTSTFGLLSGFGLRFSDPSCHALTHWMCRGDYFILLGATLILLPATAMLGGACAAYSLSVVACWGALVLAALIAGDVSLGLLGSLRLLRRLTRPRLQP